MSKEAIMIVSDNTENGSIYIFIFVDFLLICSKNQNKINEVKLMLSKCSKIKKTWEM